MFFNFFFFGFQWKWNAKIQHLSFHRKSKNVFVLLNNVKKWQNSERRIPWIFSFLLSDGISVNIIYHSSTLYQFWMEDYFRKYLKSRKWNFFLFWKKTAAFYNNLVVLLANKKNCKTKIRFFIILDKYQINQSQWNQYSYTSN